jgi:hypothetical protein
MSVPNNCQYRLLSKSDKSQLSIKQIPFCHIIVGINQINIMKKLLAFSAIALLFAACKKDDDNSGSATGNTWTLGTTTYTASAVVYQSSPAFALSATATGFTATNANYLFFSFSTAPTNGAQFSLNSTGASVVISAVKMVNSTSTTYINKTSSVKATTSITSGKVGVSLPSSIWLFNNSNINDSIQLTASSITQTM